VRRIIALEARDSARRIIGAVRHHIANAASSFGARFAVSLSEAAAIVASHQIQRTDDRSFARPRTVGIEDDTESIRLRPRVRPFARKPGIEILVRNERSRSDSEASENAEATLSEPEVRSQTKESRELVAPSVIPGCIHETPHRRQTHKKHTQKPLDRDVAVSEILQLFGVELEDLNSDEEFGPPSFRFDENPSRSPGVVDDDGGLGPEFVFAEEIKAGSAMSKSSQDSSDCPFRFESGPDDEHEDREPPFV
jgi:hypothetical protein